MLSTLGKCKILRHFYGSIYLHCPPPLDILDGSRFSVTVCGALGRHAVLKGEWKQFHNIPICFLSITSARSHVCDWFSHTEID